MESPYAKCIKVSKSDTVYKVFVFHLTPQPHPICNPSPSVNSASITCMVNHFEKKQGLHRLKYFLQKMRWIS